MNEVSPFKNLNKAIYNLNDFDKGAMSISSRSGERMMGNIRIKSLKSLHSSNMDISDEYAQYYCAQDQKFTIEQKGFVSAPNNIIRDLDMMNKLPGMASGSEYDSQEISMRPPHIDKPFFFNDISLCVYRFEQLKQFELNQVLEQYDIKSVNFLLNKFNKIWKSKTEKRVVKEKPIPQAELAKATQHFKTTLKTLHNSKYVQREIYKLLAKFKLEKYINEMTFATENYQMWLQKRLKGYDTKSIKQSKFFSSSSDFDKEQNQLQEWNNQNFWCGN